MEKVTGAIRRGLSTIPQIDKDDKTQPKSIRFTTSDEFWVLPFNYEPVIGWKFLYKVRTWDHLFKVGVAIAAMLICVFSASLVSRDPNANAAFAYLVNIFAVPYMALFFVAEFTVVDKTLFKALCHRFEFIYFVGLVLSCIWPACIDVLLRPIDIAGNRTARAIAIAVMIAGPLPFIWVAIHDASTKRHRLPTLAVVFVCAFGTGLIYCTLLGVFPKFNGFFDSSEFCVPSGGPSEFQHCATVMDTFVEPTSFQLIIFLLKYMKHMVSSPDMAIMLGGSLKRSLETVDASNLKHLQDPENSMHVAKSFSPTKVVDEEVVEITTLGNEGRNSTHDSNSDPVNHFDVEAQISGSNGADGNAPADSGSATHSDGESHVEQVDARQQ